MLKYIKYLLIIIYIIYIVIINYNYLVSGVFTIGTNFDIIRQNELMITFVFSLLILTKVTEFKGINKSSFSLYHLLVIIGIILVIVFLYSFFKAIRLEE